mgnify:CR=1 FL=1
MAARHHIEASGVTTEVEGALGLEGREGRNNNLGLGGELRGREVFREW